MEFYQEEKQNVLDAVKSSYNGLSDDEAGRRALEHGKNLLEKAKKKSLLFLFLDQLKDPMVIVLIAAAVISGILGELIDMIIIFAVVLLNSIIGLIQENKAEKAIEALQKMTSPYAKVLRGSNVSQLKSEDLVPGDIVLLDAGDFIPADMRLLESSSLKIDESALTGESVAVLKDSEITVKAEAPLGDRVNMAYMGTSVSYGRGKGVVTGTGMKTEIGKIANILANTQDEATPLQKKLAEIGKFLSIAVLLICVVIFSVNIIKHGGFNLKNFIPAFMTSVSLAVAAIPEGMPAMVTVVMALGVTKMAKRNAIVRKLPAVETLGCTQIICSDKTGTLTQNKMTVKFVYIDGNLVPAEKSKEIKDYEIFARTMVLANDSKVNKDKSEVGDPTETALLHYADLIGYNRDEAVQNNKRVADIPFDSDRKLMSSINTADNQYFLYTKGAPDEILKRSEKILVNSEINDLTEEHRKKILEANNEMAKKALRVLGAAYKPLKENPQEVTSENLENKLIFIGLSGMIDPPRPEVKDAIAVCNKAGITPVMITGDHRDTAYAIATELGIASAPEQAIFGSEIDKYNDEELTKKVDDYRVYARVSPEHKVRIVKAWKSKGKVVAMTGDGVNDAPALKTADIGVGMGITGTDVSKGVSDMVLADDNFSTIVSAVEEGRKIYNNIRKTVQFLLSTNVSEVISLFTATLFLPSDVTFLSPVQILWINLVTDSLPALSLGVDNSERDVMNEEPRDSKESIFSEGIGSNIAYQGMIIAALTLIAHTIGRTFNDNIASTMAFATLSLIQIVHSFNLRSIKDSLFKTGFFDNKYLTGSAVLSVILTVGIISIPGINGIFKVASLNITQWLIVAALSLSMLPIVETVKFFQRKNAKK